MKFVALYYDPEWEFNQCGQSMSSVNGNSLCPPSCSSELAALRTGRPLKLCLSVSRAESS